MSSTKFSGFVIYSIATRTGKIGWYATQNHCIIIIIYCILYYIIILYIHCIMQATLIWTAGCVWEGLSSCFSITILPWPVLFAGEILLFDVLCFLGCGGLILNLASPWPFFRNVLMGFCGLGETLCGEVEFSCENNKLSEFLTMNVVNMSDLRYKLCFIICNKQISRPDDQRF